MGGGGGGVGGFANFKAFWVFKKKDRLAYKSFNLGVWSLVISNAGC